MNLMQERIDDVMDRIKLENTRQWVRDELERCVNFWLEKGMDKVHGGVYTCLDRKGEIYSTDKSVWMQGRCGWMFANMCHNYGVKEEWLAASKSCLDFMEQYCINRECGDRMYFTVTEAIGSADSIVQIRTSNYQTIDITNADGISKTGVVVPNALIPTVYGTRTAASGAITVAYAAASGVTYTELTDLNVDASDPVVFTSVGIIDKAALGNNVWPYSNLSEYLNDETAAKESVEPTYMLDVPSAYNLGAGWLYGIDPRAYSLIQTAKVEWLAGRGNDDFTYNELYTAEQKVFLLSMLEMSFNIRTNEGTVTQLYSDYTDGVLSDDAFIDRAKYNRAGGTLNSYRWSRSANVSSAYYARLVTAAGSDSYGSARIEYYYAPAFILGKSSNPQSQNASSAE